MKKIFTSLALLGAFVTGANAQQKDIDLGVRYLQPVTNQTFANLANGDTLLLAIEVSNNGTEAIEVTDTLTSFIDIGFLGLSTTITSVSYPPANIPAGQKDTFTLPLIKSTNTPIPNDAKICTWISIFGFDQDLAVFNDGGFDLAAFNAATTVADLKAAFSGNNINEANNIVIGSGATDKCGTTGIVDIIKDKHLKEALVVYPNPASNNVNFDYNFKKATTATVRVLDITGREVYTQSYGKQNVGKQSFNVNIASLPNGTYSIELVTEENKAVSKFNIAK